MFHKVKIRIFLSLKHNVVSSKGIGEKKQLSNHNMVLAFRGSTKASFGVRDSQENNLDPLFQKLVPAQLGGPSHIQCSSDMDKGSTQSLLPTPKLPFYEHFVYHYSLVLPWLRPQYFSCDPLLFHFLLVGGP